MDLFKKRSKLKKFLKFLFWIVVVGLIGIQFIPTHLNQSDVNPDIDFVTIYDAPKEIAFILKNSCYDCHSNCSFYPWYSKLQPMRWLIENHINKGKEELNYNEFNKYSNRRKKSKLKSLSDQIKDDEMPLKSYLLMHKNAKLSKSDKTLLIDWFEKLRDSL